MVYEIYLCRFASAPGTSATLYLNYHLYGEPVEDAKTDYYVWVIKGRDRTVLVDTGFNKETAKKRSKTLHMEVPDFWDFLEIDRSKPVELILTHLHYDHAGNVGELSDPRIYLAKSEWDFWLSEQSKGFLIDYYREDADIARLQELEDKGSITFFEGEIEVAPGIRVLEVGGHTPGQAMVLVETVEGKMLLASDAVHFQKELVEDKPFTAVTDLPGLYAGLGQVREMLQEGEIVTVISGHDPCELERASYVSHNVGIVGAGGKPTTR